MVYVISYEDESPGSTSGKVKGKLKGKGKRSDDSAAMMSSPETPVYLVYHQWEVGSIPSLSSSVLLGPISREHLWLISLSAL